MPSEFNVNELDNLSESELKKVLLDNNFDYDTLLDPKNKIDLLKKCFMVLFISDQKKLLEWLRINILAGKINLGFIYCCFDKKQISEIFEQPGVNNYFVDNIFVQNDLEDYCVMMDNLPDKFNIGLVEKNLPKAISLVKNNVYGDKIFSGCKNRLNKNTSDDKKTFFVLRDDFSIYDRDYSSNDLFYECTEHVPADGNCGIYSAAAIADKNIDPNKLPRKEIIKLRKELSDLYKTLEAHGNNILCDYKDESYNRLRNYGEWVVDNELAQSLSLKTNRMVIIISIPLEIDSECCSVNGKLYDSLMNFFSLEDLMQKMIDLDIILLECKKSDNKYNGYHFQPLNRKNKSVRRKFALEYLEKMFYDSFAYENIIGLCNYTGQYEIEKLTKRLFTKQEANKIIKNIKEIINSTPEQDKFSVMLAITEELCQEFNARLEKFKANELELAEYSSDSETTHAYSDTDDVVSQKKFNPSDKNSELECERVDLGNQYDDSNCQKNFDNNTHGHCDNNNISNRNQIERPMKNKILFWVLCVFTFGISVLVQYIFLRKKEKYKSDLFCNKQLLDDRTKTEAKALGCKLIETKTPRVEKINSDIEIRSESNIK